jgi:hypothetical protein
MLPLSISARGSSSCRLLGKLWPLPRIRREVSTWTPSSFDPPRQIRAYYLKVVHVLATYLGSHGVAMAPCWSMPSSSRAWP